MFEYNKQYDHLFNNDEFMNILYKFHSSNWKNLSVDQRFDLIREFVDCYRKVFDIDSLKSKKKNTKYYGMYSDMNSLVDVSIDSVKKDSQYDVMDTLFHELRHNFQHRAVSGNIGEKEYASEEEIESWRENFMSSPSGYTNYISAEGEYFYLYNFQPVEEDAFRTGMTLTRRAYELISEKLGEDENFYGYGLKNKEVIMLYFSDEKIYLDNLIKRREEVFEVYKKNNKKFDIEKKCLSIAKETLKKDLDEMSDEELNSLFSVYVWPHLDDDYKIELIKEYDSRVNKYKPVSIEKFSNSGFKIDGAEVTRNNVLSILNIVFSYEFRKRVEAIVKDKEDCDEDIKRDLKINMYKVNDKQINYIKDSDNLFTYSIQPYALLEGKIVVEQFRDMQRSEEKIYGIKEGDFDSMIDFYDYNKYIPFIEKFYGKSFKTVYNEFLKQMKENIKKYSPRKK